MDLVHEFWRFAWARHHNVASWYIRPLFIVPFIYFAYNRNAKGMAATVFALATSMFWFPAPKAVDPAVARFLAAEEAFLFGPFTAQKLLLWLTVPSFFGLLGAAFWKRSWFWGAAVINLAAIGKIAWSVAEGGEAGWAVLVPAVIGMVVCDAAVFLAWKRVKSRNGSSATPPR